MVVIGARPLVRLSRPWFWPLGWGGAFLGSVLGGGQLVPPARGLLLALLLGPLVWVSVLAQNDLHDLPTDRVNPRKATAPLVTGVLGPEVVRRWHRGSAAVTLVVAAALGPAFVVGAAVVLGLGWAYSAPPLRLKARPGLDVAVNALVVGVFAPAAGWALHRPVTAYPGIWIVLGFLLAAALYLPTTVMDEASDRAAGLMTSAVRWGAERCYQAGLAMWIAADGLWLSREPTVAQVVMAPAVILGYAVLARRPSIATMAGVVAVFAVPAAEWLTRQAGLPGW
ncbi:UbiA family prenyltransferase [Actinoplanes sp. NPDC049265]|uniref:UbiA family prenyltransferase n=1 Tax=Actinoplanes sp. NPDC049265 TaxID=3363902 RepID=UPI003710F4CC